MPAVHEHSSLQEAGALLLPVALLAENWIAGHDGRLVLPPHLQSRVEGVHVAACIAVGPGHEAELRISFRAPQLSPTHAAELLEQFVAIAMPLTPHTEWRVEVDGKRWVSFCRTWSPAALVA